jgi:uncharacterized protein (DUF302 family)
LENRALTLTYMREEPFDHALKSIREALEREDLRVPLEMDLTARIKRELRVSLAPCRILFVDCPALLLEAAALDRSAAAFLPLHVAVSGLGPQTGIHVIGPSVISSTAASSALSKLQTRIIRALGEIAARQRVYELVR